MNDTMAIYRVHANGVWSGIPDEKKFVMEYETRLNIYDVDKSDAAAKYLLTQFTKLASRKWLVKHYKILLKTIRIICKHFGIRLAVTVLFNKLLLGKNYKYNE